ncbi:MAG TPA: sulfotransferase [Pirellulaceae bacterium]|nr:sulfotransferase [Pirellulaceae bacterium]
MQRVAIHSVPRSGSSWLGQIFNSSPQVIYKYQPLFSYAFKNALSPQSTRAEIIAFFESIATRKDDFLDQTEAVQRGIYPQFEKRQPGSHVVYKEVRYHHILENLLAQDEELKIIGLVRHPLAVLASWKMAPKEFKPEWDFSAEWRSAPSKNQGRPEEFFGFDKWLEVYRLFDRLSQQFSHRFRLLFYADLLRDTAAVVRQLFDWCGLEWEGQTERFLAVSRGEDRRDTYSVYNTKQHDDAWQHVLPQMVIHEVRTQLSGEPRAHLDSMIEAASS